MHRVEQGHTTVWTGRDRRRLGDVDREIIAGRAPVAVRDVHSVSRGETGEQVRLTGPRIRGQIARHPRKRRIGVVALGCGKKQVSLTDPTVSGCEGLRNVDLDRDLIVADPAKVQDGHCECRGLGRVDVRVLGGGIVGEFCRAPQPLVAFRSGQLHPKSLTDFLAWIHLLPRGTLDHRHGGFSLVRAPEVVGEHRAVRGGFRGRRLDFTGIGVVETKRWRPRDLIRPKRHQRRPIGDELDFLADTHRIDREDDRLRGRFNVDDDVRVDGRKASRGVGDSQNHAVRPWAREGVGRFVFVARGVVIKRPQVGVPGRGRVLKVHIQSVAQHPFIDHVNAHIQLSELKLEHPQIAVEAVVCGTPGSGGCGQVAVASASRAHRLVHRAVFVKPRGPSIHVLGRLVPTKKRGILQVRSPLAHHRQPEISVVRFRLKCIVCDWHAVGPRIENVRAPVVG